MTLAELAFACHIYASMTDYDSSYCDFRSKIDDELDLTDADHRQALITWLNQWGCRQFSKECHGLASAQILQWYEDCREMLPMKGADLLSIAPYELESASEAYAKLTKMIACRKPRGERTVVVTVGPTGAAKILFALRPNVLVPWDEPIRAKFNYDSSEQSFYRFHMTIKEELSMLESQCKKLGVALKDLPQLLNRQHSTTPKLIDEFYWVTITRNCQFPGGSTLEKWINWNKA
ncbi:hypothetical protein GURASL_16810 [Geotalea uraniireducens]|uniref:Uncharacterized protein n=1 Tax=Geotalea uraniireducens TaxID=351604 RepID=A0ABN6VR01_9BACT|nr:hypothetical protein [Geotalea uraniireducens]BDV42758.1 hypothetical protein GURASL_16810 [Geotalea uraniireducens]